MPRLIRRRRDGSYVLRLPEGAIALLGQLADQVDPLLDDPSADSGLRRLFPPAHTEDVLAEAAWQIEQGESLRDSRRASLAALDQPAGEPMDEDQLVAWVQGVNALRLVLSERLGVEADTDELRQLLDADEALGAFAPDDASERAQEARRLMGAWQLYDMLGALLAEAVRALESGER